MDKIKRLLETAEQQKLHFKVSTDDGVIFFIRKAKPILRHASENESLLIDVFDKDNRQVGWLSIENQELREFSLQGPLATLAEESQ